MISYNPFIHFLNMDLYYPSHAHGVVIIWSPSKPSLEKCHIEQTTVEAEELEQVVLQCQGVVKILLSSEN